MPVILPILTAFIPMTQLDKILYIYTVLLQYSVVKRLRFRVVTVSGFGEGEGGFELLPDGVLYLIKLTGVRFELANRLGLFDKSLYGFLEK